MKNSNTYEKMNNHRYKLINNCYIKADKLDSNIGSVYIKQNHPLQNFFRFLSFNIPLEKKIALDQFGFFVINKIIENNKISEIVESLESKFGEDISPTQERLCLFLQQLVSLKIIKIVNN